MSCLSPHLFYEVTPLRMPEIYRQPGGSVGVSVQAFKRDRCRFRNFLNRFCGVLWEGELVDVTVMARQLVSARSVCHCDAADLMTRFIVPAGWWTIALLITQSREAILRSSVAGSVSRGASRDRPWRVQWTSRWPAVGVLEVRLWSNHRITESAPLSIL